MSAPLVWYSDPLIDSSAEPLPRSEERELLKAYVARGGVRGRCDFGGLEEPIVTAGILADGTTTGDALLLNRLILRRINMLQAVETTLEILSDAGRHNVPRDQLIEQFRKTACTLDRWYLPPEQQVGRGLYRSIIVKLKNLPEVRAGSPFPPGTFVEQESAMLRQQRVTLLESQPSLASAALTPAP